MLKKIAGISYRYVLDVGKKACFELLEMNSFTRMKKQIVSNLSTDINTGVSHSSSHIKNVYKDLDNRCLKVTWSDGSASRFPYNFLRDNCKCPQCYESSSKQKLFNAARDMKMDIQAEEAIVSEDGQHLKCLWAGGHESGYPSDWLHNMRMPEKKEFRQQNSDNLIKDELILWNREKMQDKIPCYDYNAVMNVDKSLFDLLYCLYQNGIVLLNDAPARDGILIDLAARVGYSKTTNYGEIFNVKHVQNPSNLAYTEKALNFHSDLPYLRSPPSIQLLHCIIHNNMGGNNVFVDAFNVCKQLYLNDPDTFDVLKSFHVQYCDRGTDAFGEFIIGCSHPVINLNKNGRIYNFLYNPPVESESAGHCTPEELLAFYDASYRLVKGLTDSKNVIDIHLKSGQIVMFHNTRVLHGRTAYESTEKSVERWLQGVYFDWDIVFSKLRVLQKNLGLKTPYLYEQSDDFF